MELKDVILSTLAEIDQNPSKIEESTITKKEPIVPTQEEIKEEVFVSHDIPVQKAESQQLASREEELSLESELMYLNSIKERLLVLFEGFQAPNNKNIEAKIDMTLNFLEYTLATIDTRIEKLEKGKR